MNEKEQIYDFIINNKLERLELEQKKFNPFKVLNIDHHEIRHSNVLAWLLNPSENHNFGDKILKKVIFKILVDSANQEVVPDNIDLKDIHLAPFTDAKVFREKDNIDILITSSHNQFVLLIENKLSSKESKGQLKTYLNKVKENYPEYNILPVFLTINKEEPKGEQYCVLDYYDICEIVDETAELYKENISEDAFNFIQYYLETLRSIIAMDESTKQLCRELYKEHKEAIDMIYYIGNELDISIALNEFKTRIDDNIEVTTINPKWVWFLLPEFKKVPKMNTDWGGGYPVSFWFSEYYKNLKLVLEIGPFDNSLQRIEFLKLLEKKNVNIRQSAKQHGRKYTRICTDTEKISDWQDKDEILEKMLKLYNKKKMIETKKALLETINEFKWE